MRAQDVFSFSFFRKLYPPCHRSLVIIFHTTRTGLLSNELTAWKLVLTTNRGHRMSRLEHTPLAVPGPAAYQFGCCRILSGFQKLLCVASAQPDYLVQVWGNQPLLRAKRVAGGKRHMGAAVRPKIHPNFTIEIWDGTEELPR